MSETRDLGIKWPQWHTLASGRRQVQVDMRHVCPQDVEKMHVKQARSAHSYWRKWAANHENEE